jgi:ribosome-associated toxin RatA of RatAB toxin-antitoxin module
MTYLHHEVEIKRPVAVVYALAKDVESYPNFLPGYVHSKIVTHSDDGALLRRAALIRGELVEWTSWVRWRENRAIHFEQQEGPLRGMKVFWHFQPLASDRTRLTITHFFRIPKPIIGSLLEQWVFKPRLNEIALQIVAAFKYACEKEQVVAL